MVITSVPAMVAVPTTRSPSAEFNLLTVPVSGETMVVLARASSVLANDARAISTWCSELVTWARATS